VRARKEEENGAWSKLFDQVLHESSVNSIAWAPHVFGLILATASADGKVCVLSYKPESNAWERDVIQSPGGLGVNSVSWAPGVPSAALFDHNNAASQRPQKRLVTGGCDGRVRIWAESSQPQQQPHQGQQQQQAAQWVEQPVDGEATKHADWVRDVAWAPSLGLPTGTIASCSEDQTVAIWTEAAAGQPWTRAHTLRFDHKVWRVSWSVMGNILAVAQGDNRVSLWKESVDGAWTQISALTENDRDEQQQQQQPF
jgi:protein transport protein SEC13